MADHNDPEPDIHNFSTSSSHRLPTISGVEALQNASIKARGIATNLQALDLTLLPTNIPLATSGIQRGHVTEIFGPPGVGKTTFGLQIALNAMHDRQDESHVLWVNTGAPLIEERLDEMIAAYTIPPDDHDPKSSPPVTWDSGDLVDEKFTYMEATSLPRVLTLFLHSTHDFPPPETCLIIVDDLSNLLLGSFSRNPKNIKAAAPAAVREKLAKRAIGKRFETIENLAAGLSKLAALRHIAVVVLTNATTSLKGGQVGVLKPTLSSQAWDSAIHTRIMLYRDFPPEEFDGNTENSGLTGLRYAEVQKLDGHNVYTQPVPFHVTSGGIRVVGLPATSDGNDLGHEEGGISDLPSDPDLPALPLEVQLPERSVKRKIDEIAESEEDNDPRDSDDDGAYHGAYDEGDEIHAQTQPQDDAASNQDEPELPVIPQPRHLSLESRDEEMILDLHETSLLRSYRHCIIRGSEDAEPVPSSDVDEEVGDSDDDGEIVQRPP